MRCHQVREALTALSLGDLGAGRSERVQAHLTGCADCRRAQREHDDLAALLARYEAPALPEAFGQDLGKRLHAEAGQPEMPAAPSRWTAGIPSWPRVLRAAVLVAAGVALGALGLWSLSSRQAPGPTPAAPSTTTRASHAPTPDHAAALRLKPGEVAVVTLVLRAERAHPSARLEVVLPDGVALIGENQAEYPEKLLRWSEPLQAGVNRIRVPIRATRAGRYQLVAHARAGAQRVTARTRLVITDS